MDQGQAASLLTDTDVFLFNEGRHFRLAEKLGAHVIEHDGVRGTFFAVWAPDADAVSVIGGSNESSPFLVESLHGSWLIKRPASLSSSFRSSVRASTPRAAGRGVDSL